MKTQVTYSDKDIEDTLLKQLYDAVLQAAEDGVKDPFSDRTVNARQLGIAIAKAEGNDEKGVMFRSVIIEAQITKVGLTLVERGFVLSSLAFIEEKNGGSGTFILTPAGFSEAEGRYDTTT